MDYDLPSPSFREIGVREEGACCSGSWSTSEGRRKEGVKVICRCGFGDFLPVFRGLGRNFLLFCTDFSLFLGTPVRR